MKTLAAIEERSDEIKARINHLFNMVNCLPLEGEEMAFAEAAAELNELLIEAQSLNTTLLMARQMAEQLINGPCSGPH